MMKQTLNRLMLIAAAALLAGCKTGSTVRIENAAPQPVATARSEPIFYNGKTYQLDFRPNGAGAYDMAVSGMGPKQKKDAVNVATSSLSYYACPDGHRGRLLGDAAYAGAKWRLQAKCG